MLLAGGSQNIIVSTQHLLIEDSRARAHSGSEVCAELPCLTAALPVILCEPQRTANADAESPEVSPCRPAGPLHDDFQRCLVASRQQGGFLLDYVIHSLESGPGPHSIEVTLSRVSLHWPYLADLQLVWDVVQVFSHFAFVLWPPGTFDPPEHPGWMFVNVLLRQGQLLVLSPREQLLDSSRRRPSSWLPALALHWEMLRVGYDWRGGQEFVLLVTVRNLAAHLVKKLTRRYIEHHWCHVAGWNHDNSFPAHHKHLLEPLTGDVRWHALQHHQDPAEAGPGAQALQKVGSRGRNSLPASAGHSSAGLEGGLVGSSGPGATQEAMTATQCRMNKISVCLDTLQLQPLLSDRWHLQSLMQFAQSFASATPDASAGSASAYSTMSGSAEAARADSRDLVNTSIGSAPQAVRQDEGGTFDTVPVAEQDSAADVPLTADGGCGTCRSPRDQAPQASSSTTARAPSEACTSGCGCDHMSARSEYASVFTGLDRCVLLRLMEALLWLPT